MTTVAVSPRKRAGSRSAQNHHSVPVSVPVPIPDTNNNSNSNSINRRSNMAKSAIPTTTNNSTNKNTGINNNSNSSSILGDTKNTQQQPPKLSKMIYVLKLVSSDQPNEYMKVLNIPQAPQTLKIGRQNTPKTSNKITDGFFDSRVLSRNHAELFVKDDGLYIRDLKSSNGTFLNDSKLEPYEDYKLNINDKIDLGTTLESQMAHRKITCIIREFQQISLKSFQDLVDEIVNKDDMINQKLELFNSTFDALLFGEIVDDIVVGGDTPNDDLLSLIEDKDDKPADVIITHGKFKSDLDLKSTDIQDMIKKLIVAVNNEYIQQQRLKEMNKFLKNYNNSVAGYENTSIFRVYDKLLKSSKTSISVQNDEDKYHKMEAQVKRFQHELESVRRHLSTAQAKEKEMAETHLANEELKKSLQSLQEETEELRSKLQSCQGDYRILEKRVQQKEREKQKEEEAQATNNAADHAVETDTSDDAVKRKEGSETQVVWDVSSAVLRYGGLAMVSFVIVWYLHPAVLG